MYARPERGNVAGMIEVCDPAKQVRCDVFVRSPRRGGLTRLLAGMGATVLAEPGPGLSVTGMEPGRIASVAAAHYIPIQD
jgi:ABC-2 type transport system ATP-binding protein